MMVLYETSLFQPNSGGCNRSDVALRAAVSLARLRCEHETATPVRSVLAAICDWFTEGLEAPDLAEARELLDRHSGALARSRAGNGASRSQRRSGTAHTA